MTSLYGVQAKQLRTTLSDASVAFKNQSYIGDKVAPIKDGVSYKSSFTVFNRGDAFRNEAEIRAAGGLFPMAQIDSSQVNVNPKIYALGDAIPKEELEAAMQEGSTIQVQELEQDAVEYVSDKIDLSKEVRIANLIKSTTWADGVPGGEDVGGLWAPEDSTNTAVSDIRGAITAMKNETGYIANKMLLDFGTFQKMKDNLRLRDQLKYTGSQSITEQAIAAFFGFDEVLVGSAMLNTANKSQTPVMENIWETNQGKGGAFVFYSPRTMGRRTASALAQFRVPQTGGVARLVEGYYSNGRRSDVVQVQEATDIVVKGNLLGYHFKDTIAD